ncbi:tripartite tricarboxylate transporter TctB family protein [Antarcticirhabdus aurantiaca]|uniref:Tripartite tricarboxylate transporter TctB family protein n=1 Tax=Antarcticirhabdus aurantiaca TaxID=2606717 RepID=A0ACD4NJH8_9HYPH|nr:tripartite tricarboxylate transporter TctB family protein [Antarcticirhabdus aurantiaca]WAJ26936.1 tripartite tricarboxylate transporter TctB family protein [Jeongeuplla avenae]
MSEQALHKQNKMGRDVMAGAIFLVIALAFGAQALSYDMGRTIRMGPGFIPLTLAVLLGIFGIAVAVAGFRKHDTAEVGPVAWRGIFLVCVSLVIFGAYGRQLGLVPVVFICVFIVAMASVKNTVVSALAIAAALAVMCWLVFKVGLGMSLHTIGPAFGPFQVF